MRPSHLFVLVFASLALVASGCDCGHPPVGDNDGGDDNDSGCTNCTGDGGGDAGPRIDGGNGDGGGNPGNDGGTGDGGSNPQDGGSTDAGPRADAGNPDNTNLDSDCDGLTDAEEFSTIYPGNLRTSPNNADSDGDGIPDGTELGLSGTVDPRCPAFIGDVDPTTATNPTQADSDQDGIPDGAEDKNHNGRVDTGETNPNSPDTDGDGLSDGAEDVNHNGLVDPGETDPLRIDTDGDGINDGVELTVTHTNPILADTDGDGCVDGAEDINRNGTVDPGETNALVQDCGTSILDTDGDGLPDALEDATGTNKLLRDTDGDGLEDGLEDRNHSGRVDPGETNPRLKDTDCDGLIDGPDQLAAGLRGEDRNGNGLIDPGETDPTNADTDGDGLIDGREKGVTTAQNPDPTGCPAFVGDTCPATTTNPLVPDSDGDGIADGAEDANQNGCVDSGELDPGNGGDGSGPAGQACSAANLRPVTFRQSGGPDLQIALPPSFTEVTNINNGAAGATRGMMGYDSVHKVAFLLYRQTAPAGSTNPTADEAALRTPINGAGALTNVTTQTFTTWDSYPAVKTFYDQAGAGDLKTQANTLATTLMGPGSGVLTGTAGAVGPFKVQAEFVHRSDQSVVVLIALTQLSNFIEPAIFTVGDTAGGSALAQFGDANAVNCEVFTTNTPKVDFLFSVDNSGSMAGYQAALGSAASALATKLNNSSLDWRIALVDTDYHITGSTNSNIRRGFTRSIGQFTSWMTNGSTCGGAPRTCSNVAPRPACDPSGGSNGGCWVGTGGNGAEGILGAARKATDDIGPPSATEVPDKLRQGAQLVVILLGDADDQTHDYTNISHDCDTAVGADPWFCENPVNFQQYFGNDPAGSIPNHTRNSLGVVIPVNGIICPTPGTATPPYSCGEYNNDPQRHAAVITSTGGVRGDISNAASITASINAIVDNAINAAGHRTSRSPIGASIKVALGAVLDPTNCNKDDLPRSRINGFDFDGVSQSISLFGACRPANPGVTQAAVSYRYWIQTVTNPNGQTPPCFGDPDWDPTDPDWCRGRLTCDLTTNTCFCPPNCGAPAPPGKVCDSNRAVCDFVCTPDCGGTCTGYTTCNTGTCACVCVPTATCSPGFVFRNSGGQCGCYCDTAALNCGPSYDPDPTTCSCQCRPDCGGGCDLQERCNVSTCQCQYVG